jgi:ATP-binding cassette subfamily C exporter for protease/lipase
MKFKFRAPQNEVAQVLVSFKKAFRNIGVFSAVINMLMLMPAIYMLQLYDSVLTSRNETTLLMLTLIMLGAYIFMGALEYIRSFVLIRVGAQLDMKLNKRVYTAAFEESLKQGDGNAGQALKDLTNLRQFLTGNALFAFFDAPWFPIYLFVIFMFHPGLGIFALCGTAILIALAYINEKISHKPLAEANSMAVASTNVASNNLRNAEVIEAMGMLPNIQSRWYKLHSRFLNLQAEASEKSGVMTALSKSFTVALQSLMLGLGALLVLENSITPGMMIAGSILLGRAIAPVQLLISVWKQIGSTRSAYERLTQLLEHNPAREAGMALPKPVGIISVESVTAAPPGGKIPVIKGLSFSLGAGEALGIIGPSGSGKSTLARLLVGIWPAASGKVRLDGADVYLWNKDELGPHIGYLPQDVELFAGTVSENIARFGEIHAEKVILASKRAGVHEMILNMPEGYDTVLGARGIVYQKESIQTILKVIEKVHDGELWFDRETSSRTFLQNFHMRKTVSPSINTRKISALTRKECEILKVLSQASGSEQNKQIAAHLQMSEYTLRNHLSAIFKKLGINNRFGLFMYARRHFQRFGSPIHKVLQ